jgi:hypothetical protein
MKINSATIDQLIRSRTGGWIHVEADVGSVAQQIEEIGRDRGATFELRLSERTGIFTVVQILGDEEQLVTTAQECDQRLVDRLRLVTSPSYDLGAEVDRAEAEKDRNFQHAQSEQVGEIGEQLAWAMRKDLGTDLI